MKNAHQDDSGSPTRERRDDLQGNVHTLPALTRRATLMAALSLAAFAVAAPVEITLPAETARLAESPLPGYKLATTYCYTCHSVDYVKIQPTSSRAYWKGSVVKMQKTFGAPIPEDAVEPLADYLVKTYGAERPATPPSAAAPTSPAKSKKSSK